MFDNQGKSFIFRNVLYRGIIDQIVWLPAVVRGGILDQSHHQMWPGKVGFQSF